ncbi:MAG: PD-(D/E)XK nuclease family protein [Acidobacteriaceae bacterium]|jgi:RecB family exonuclease|nr:PD-(D/E)XK nuclease family protein [Acidobacteriaceae bacterium]
MTAVITPRRTRLVRVLDLHQFRRTLADLAEDVAFAGKTTLAVVPRQSAGRVFEDTVIRSRSGEPRASITFVTRGEMYEAFHRRLADPPRLLGAEERDVLAQAAATEMAAAGDPLPFQVRPGLVAEMLRFYDQLRRQSQQTERFEELIVGALGGAETEDLGAQRLVRETRFLAGTFRAYEERVSAAGARDEHGLRDLLCREVSPHPIERVIVTVPDWIADPDGLFVADFDLLTRIPGLESLDILSTSAVLASGFHERIHTWWPGLEEVEGVADASTASRPLLVRPMPDETDALWFTYRDREEELAAIARRIVSGEQGAHHRARSAVVYKRPLPYLYLAPDTLTVAGLSYQTYDALPLAAEPIVATVDLILDAVETDFSRTALVALLNSPFVVWTESGARVDRAAVASLNRALSDARYLGGRDRLSALAAEQEAPLDAVFAVALQVTACLAPFLTRQSASAHLDAFLSLLRRQCRPAVGETFTEREYYALGRVLARSEAMADAHRAHDDPEWTIVDLAAALRRAIGEETCASGETEGGVYLLDDQAARYGDFDDITIVGLVDSEWPERLRRNIFYGSPVMHALGWPSEKDRRAAADARFLDLLASPAARIELSTVLLDDEAVVTRSVQLDEVESARLSTIARHDDPPDVMPVAAGDALRADRANVAAPEFHGATGPRASRPWSVSALEAYLACPFKFFAQHILKLEEAPDDEEVMDPRRQGQLVHEVFEEFFRRWQASGHGAIAAADLPSARELFVQVVDETLRAVSPVEAGLERTRLLGSPAAAGLGEVVFRMEAERTTPVVERLLEQKLDGEFELMTADGPRRVALRGKADRIDLLADGTFRLIDYKLGWPPEKSRALQLPIYARCAEQRLAGYRGRAWRVGEAMYLAFKGPRRVIPLFKTPEQQAEIVASAEQRVVDAVDAIARGEFPPSPKDIYLCDACAFTAVCRKDYVGNV